MPIIIYWNEINAIGTLLFAGIALFAIFYPQLLDKYKSPKFSFEIVSYGNQPGKVQSINIRATNTGKRVAHGVVGFIEISDPKEKKNLLYGQIPVQRTNETYDEVIVYPMQSCELLCMKSGNLRIGAPPHLEITSYPYTSDNRYWPPLTSLKESSSTKPGMCINEERTYIAIVKIFCEELSKPSTYNFSFIYSQERVKILNRTVIME
ncbi:MAG: hypothetical protein JRN37_00610 [Nitrososphaerota archaeon]|jgi:hypothetical protein|nr:hypothetical protein [Nitrososphaerota archaeon]MDG7037484.1 hypothetical protein [Nitrososphaerota archaeon]MDG7037653.1 hypothetical protein [Nitrososphaerota archaeon]